jgi:formylglycine-generating enzyme required for sulfatase activity
VDHIRKTEVVFLQISNQTGEIMQQIRHCTQLAKSYEPNGYNLYNMAGNVSEWTDSSYDPNAYEYVSSMNPNVLDASNKQGSSRWFMKDVAYFLQVSTRDFEYADSARSFIGFRTVQDYMGLQTTGNGKKIKIDKNLLNQKKKLWHY